MGSDWDSCLRAVAAQSESKRNAFFKDCDIAKLTCSYISGDERVASGTRVRFEWFAEVGGNSDKATIEGRCDKCGEIWCSPSGALEDLASMPSFGRGDGEVREEASGRQRRIPNLAHPRGSEALAAALFGECVGTWVGRSTSSSVRGSSGLLACSTH